MALRRRRRGMGVCWIRGDSIGMAMWPNGGWTGGGHAWHGSCAQHQLLLDSRVECLRPSVCSWWSIHSPVPFHSIVDRWMPIWDELQWQFEWKIIKLLVNLTIQTRITYKICACVWMATGDHFHKANARSMTSCGDLVEWWTTQYYLLSICRQSWCIRQRVILGA